MAATPATERAKVGGGKEGFGDGGCEMGDGGMALAVAANVGGFNLWKGSEGEAGLVE